MTTITRNTWTEFLINFQYFLATGFSIVGGILLSDSLKKAIEIAFPKAKGIFVEISVSLIFLIVFTVLIAVFSVILYGQTDQTISTSSSVTETNFSSSQ